MNDPEGGWTVGAAARVENFEDSARPPTARSRPASASSGPREHRVPGADPGQQNGFNISTIFDPALGDLVNNGTIPSNSPVAALRGGVPLQPETSVNYPAGVVFDTGPFSFTADYFRIDVSDRHNRHHQQLHPRGTRDRGAPRAGGRRRPRPPPVPVLHQRVRHELAGHRPRVDVHAHRPARQHTVFSAVFNYTDTEVTDNRQDLLNDRRLAEFRLGAAADALEHRRYPAHGAGEPSRPGQLLRGVVRPTTAGSRASSTPPAASRTASSRADPSSTSS